jgi:hypothetical protein
MSMIHLVSWETLSGFLERWLFSGLGCLVLLSYYEVKRPFDKAIPITDSQKKEISKAVNQAAIFGGFVIAIFWQFQHSLYSY